jgi:alcohol dehydrogenase YqhD (iron-dependent ADH family)
MENFMWDGASRVIFGKGVENEVGKWVKMYGGTKILLHYGGGSIKKSGLYDRVMKSLKAENIEVIALGGVVPNPKVSLIRDAIKLCKEKSVNLILAVGGGSTIDSAKGIAVGVPYKGDVWDFSDKKIPPKEALPVGVVLTIPAAGSETSKYAVATNEDGPYPYKRDIVYENNEIIRPKFAVMNPELTFTLPPYQTAVGVTDIMAHAMERYFTSVKNVELTDRLIEALLKTVINNARIVMKDPNNYAARGEIMWAGSIAHNDQLGTGRQGDFVSHMVEHELSAVYDIAHGAGLAIIFPAWAKYVYKFNVGRFARFATEVWNVDMNYEDQEKTALEGIYRMESFFKEIVMTTRLKDVKIPTDRFDEMAEKCVKLGSIKKVTKEDVVKIFKLAV